MRIVLNIFKDVARLINPPAHYSRYYKNNSATYISDFESLKSDWQSVGRDLKKVLAHYGGK